ncbi:MAG: BtpA/SgcQ family protein [Minisyncoccota bacterium]
MRKNKLFVVVHATDEEQTVKNVRVAFDNGAHGIFLINHAGVSTMGLRNLYFQVREIYPKGWIGINFLGPDLKYLTDNLKSYLPKDAQALWCDTLGYDQRFVKSARVIGALNLNLSVRRVAPGAMIFGGFDFKYQEPVKDLSLGVKELGGIVDVLTTSGSKTGSPPSLEKLIIMRETVGPTKHIAVASGMTPENVDPFLDLVDYFLVATGISKSFDELDPARVLMMADKMHR